MRTSGNLIAVFAALLALSCRGAEDASAGRTVAVTYHPGLCDASDPACVIKTLSLDRNGTLSGRGAPRTVDPAAAAGIFQLAREAFAEKEECGRIRPDESTFEVVFTESSRQRSVQGTEQGCPKKLSEIARRVNALDGPQK